MEKGISSIATNGDNSVVDAPQGGYFPIAGSELAAIRNLAPAKKSRRKVKPTPIRPSLLSDSVVSSASSLSTNASLSSASSIFDDSTSRVETPLTPPLATDSSTKIGVAFDNADLKRISKLSLTQKAAQEIKSAKPIPPSTTRSTGTPQQCSATPLIQDQDGDLFDFGIEDGVSSKSSLPKEDESPAVRRARRVKLDRQNKLDIEDFSAQLQALSLGPKRPRRSVTTRGRNKVSLECSLRTGEHSHKATREEDYSDDNLADEISSTEFNTNSKGSPSIQLAHSLPPEKISLNIEHQATSVSPAIPSRDLLCPKKSPTSRSTSCTETTTTPHSDIRSGDRPIKVVNSQTKSQSRSLSSKVEKRPARKALKSSLESGDASAVTPNPITSPNSSWPAPQTVAGFAASRVAEPESNPDTERRLLNLRETKFKKDLIRGKEPPVTCPIFDRYHKNEKQRRQLDIEMLRVIRRQQHEKKLRKSRTIQLASTRVLIPIFRRHPYPQKPLPKFNEDYGFIYIFKSPLYPGYVKIGKTKQEPKLRVSQWQDKCKFTCNHITDDKDKGFQNYGVVESIIAAELWNERRTFKCKACGKEHARQHAFQQGASKLIEHGEWYEITEAHALQVVEKWRNWVVTQRPYSQDGVLYDFWKWKHDQAMKFGDEAATNWTRWRFLCLFDLVHYYFHSIHLFLGVAIPSIAAITETLAYLVLFCLAIWLVGNKTIIGAMLLCCPVLRYLYM